MALACRLPGAITRSIDPAARTTAAQLDAALSIVALMAAVLVMTSALLLVVAAALDRCAEVFSRRYIAAVHPATKPLMTSRRSPRGARLPVKCLTNSP